MKMEKENVSGSGLLERVKMRAIAGEGASVEDALRLSELCGTDELCDAADEVRSRWCGNRVDTCSIANARSGRCTEDCKWCAQSRHYATGVKEYEYISRAQAVDEALGNSRKGVARFSLVTSGRKVAPADMERFCDIFKEIKSKSPIRLCASMGLLSAEQLVQLKEAGVTRYHCNLETSSSYFPELCSTHSHEDKLRTIAAARAAGLEVCSGGIIGMGESLRQRLEMAREVRDAGAVSMPVNVLQPIPGTPLAGTPLIGEEEVVRSVALMRLVAPKVSLRFAGGRARLSDASVERMLRGGVSGSIVGDLLTTVGRGIDHDFGVYRKLGRDY